MSAIKIIRCDSCSAEHEFEGPLVNNEAHYGYLATKLGWGNEAGKDYCPKCWQFRRKTRFVIRR